MPEIQAEMSAAFKRKGKPTIEGISMEPRAIAGVAGAVELSHGYEIVKIPGGLRL